jgi:hypothetical protein
LRDAESYPTLSNTGEGKKKKKKKKSKKKKLEQSDPPRIGLSKFFPDGIYPEGEIQPYKDECVFSHKHLNSSADQIFFLKKSQQCLEDYFRGNALQ